MTIECWKLSQITSSVQYLKLSALSTSGNLLIRQVNQVCCTQHTTYWKLYICRFNFTAKRPTRNPSDQDGNSSWRPFTLRNNYLSTAKIPNDLRITKNTFENLICCNIRNIKSNYLKFLRNIYHNLLCYYFFFNRTTFFQTPNVLVIIWLFSSRR